MAAPNQMTCLGKLLYNYQNQSTMKIRPKKILVEQSAQPNIFHSNDLRLGLTSILRASILQIEVPSLLSI